MTTSNPAPLSVTATLRSAWHDFRRCWAALVLFEAGFKLLEAWLFVPAVALLLSAVLARTGRVAVSNRDILDFVLTPMGLLYAAVLGTVAVALLLLQQAGIIALAAQSERGTRPSPVRMIRTALRMAWHVAQLGAVAVVLLALTFLPFVLLAALTYSLLLTGHDIYYYVTVRPPNFWLAAGIGAVLLAAAAAVGLWLYVRWAFALPIVLFEQSFAPTALRSSGYRVRGVGWRVGFVLVGWQLAALALGVALTAAFRLAAAAVLARAGEWPVALILTLLVVQGALLAAVSFVTVVGQGLLTYRLYRQRSGQFGIVFPGPPVEDPAPAAPWPRRLAWVAMALAVVTPVAVWADLPRHLAARPPVRVTAHRGHSRLAPENTLRAVQKAIDSGADYAEIDVQQTSDGVIVLLHDSDLKRVAGLSRRIADVPFDEARRLDVGSWFDPGFAGERIPTLAEVIDLARGRIRLNIELKVPGRDRRLAEAVAGLLGEKGFESECLITSFDQETLAAAKRHNPKVRTGLIVAQALGNVSRLDVDALSVRADWLSDDVLRAAHRHGQEVHVWTVSDPQGMTQFMKRGVDNLITDDPDLLIHLRDEWANRSGPERLVLAARLLLGLEP